MPRGFFSVCVEYDNELLAIGAVKLAERIIAALDTHTTDVLDMPGEIARLHVIAQIGSELDTPTWGFSAGNKRSSTDTTAPRRRTVRRRVPRSLTPVG